MLSSRLRVVVQDGARQASDDVGLVHRVKIYTVLMGDLREMALSSYVNIIEFGGEKRRAE